MACPSLNNVLPSSGQAFVVQRISHSKCSLRTPGRKFPKASSSKTLRRKSLCTPRAADGVDLLDPKEAPQIQGVSSIPGSGVDKTHKSRGGNIPLDPKDIIMVQGFNWGSPHSRRGWYNVVKEMAGDLARVGITDVWLPPPSKSVDRNGYLPTQLYNLDASSFGGEQNLKELLDLLHSQGLRAHADIVINHRCGDFQDDHGNWTIFEGGTPDERLDWGPWAIAAGDQPYGGHGQPDTGDDYGAAPDIDHTNPRVQDELTKWMLWLKQEIGFDGWRFDFVKGYAGYYTKLYCERTNPVFAVGELWGNMSYEHGGLAYNQDHHRQQLVNWVDSTGGQSAAFDFTTKGILQEACRNTEFWRLRDQNGKPSGMIGYWPSKAVTFIDNHDTGSTQNHWPFPSDKVMQGYAYILTHPGVPCIFWDHIFDWGHKEKIAELIDIRKRNGLNAKSPVNILAADADLYLAKIGDRVVVKLGPRFDLGGLVPSSEEYKIAAFGDGYAVWERK